MKISNLAPGVILSNEELRQIFCCSSQGGMRRSHKTKTLVLISNHLNAIYEDRWEENIFYYTGMGLKGDQSLEFGQNKTLAQSNEILIHLHLFEVFRKKQYTYRGEVFLDGLPYIEKQLDINYENRKVYIFPLKCDTAIGEISKDDIDYIQKNRQKNIEKLTNAQLKKIVLTFASKLVKRQHSSTIYNRNLYFSEFIKRLANGICLLCLNQAPFVTSKGKPFLETHHIQWLSKGGKDCLNNMVALCPNCHRKMHFLNDKKDIALLKKRVRDLL